MKYTFLNSDSGTEKTVTIPDDYIKKNKVSLGITTKEAIDMWLSDEGYIVDPVVEELTNRAKQNGDGVRAKGKRKSPVRKPDYTKRELIELIYNSLTDERITDLKITNIERIISFSLGEDKYEITLSKKRK